MILSPKEPNSNELSRMFYLQAPVGPCGHGQLVAFMASRQPTSIFLLAEHLRFRTAKYHLLRTSSHSG